MSNYGVRDDRERIAFNPAHLDDYGLDPYEFRTICALRAALVLMVQPMSQSKTLRLLAR